MLKLAYLALNPLINPLISECENFKMLWKDSYHSLILLITDRRTDVRTDVYSDDNTPSGVNSAG